MQLPYDSNATLVYLDPIDQYMIRNGSTVQTIYNRAGNQAMIQLVGGSQPGWSGTAMGSLPGWVFSGGQRIVLGVPSGTYSRPNPLVVSMALTGTSSFNSPISLGSATLSNPQISFAITLTVDQAVHNVLVNAVDDSNHLDQSEATVNINANVHILTALIDNTQIITRIDGAVVNTAAVTSSTTLSVNQLVLGDNTDGVAGHTYYTGNVGKVIISRGDVVGLRSEEYLLDYYGINHTVEG
jgi:hypothetical protein